MRKRLKEMSNEKLAMIGVFIVLLILVGAVTLATVAPQVLGAIGVLLLIGAFLSVVYGFCYAVVKDFRGEGW